MTSNRSESRNHFASTIIVLGLLLIAISFAWTWMYRGRLVWNDEVAVQYQQAAANYHGQLNARPNLPPSQNATDSSFDAARNEYERLENQLTAAQSGASNVASGVRWVGILFSITGLVLYFRSRS